MCAVTRCYTNHVTVKDCRIALLAASVLKQELSRGRSDVQARCVYRMQMTSTVMSRDTHREWA